MNSFLHLAVICATILNFGFAASGSPTSHSDLRNATMMVSRNLGGSKVECNAWTDIWNYNEYCCWVHANPKCCHTIRETKILDCTKLDELDYQALSQLVNAFVSTPGGNPCSDLGGDASCKAIGKTCVTRVQLLEEGKQEYSSVCCDKNEAGVINCESGDNACTATKTNYSGTFQVCCDGSCKTSAGI